MGLQINVSIYDAGKSLLLTRTKYVTLRTFGIDPYFAVIGERDSVAGDRAAAPEGEVPGMLLVRRKPIPKLKSNITTPRERLAIANMIFGARKAGAAAIPAIQTGRSRNRRTTNPITATARTYGVKATIQMSEARMPRVN